MIVEVPCNVGDYVYELSKSRGKIETKKVRRIEIYIGSNNLCVIHVEFEVYGFCRASDFGETIFTNHADALHALDEYLSRKKTCIKKS